ncbi:MAG: FeoA family protein [Clostridia bacterium]
MINLCSLDKLPIRQTAIIHHLKLLPQVCLRFAEMGFVPEQEITVIKKAPFGDPLEISIMNYRVCIRKTEAEHIFVSVKGEA